MSVKWLILSGLLLLNIGCRKDETNTTALSGSLPGSCSGVVANYSGAVTGSPQDIAITADIVNHPSDKLYIYLCRNTDCAVNPIPAVSCSTVPLSQTATACFTASPSQMVSLGTHLVRFTNANRTSYSDQAHALAQTPDIPAYSSYYISEQLCR